MQICFYIWKKIPAGISHGYGSTCCHRFVCEVYREIKCEISSLCMSSRYPSIPQLQASLPVCLQFNFLVYHSEHESIITEFGLILLIGCWASESLSSLLFSKEWRAERAFVRKTTCNQFFYFWRDSHSFLCSFCCGKDLN